MFGHQDDKNDDDESSNHGATVAPDEQAAETIDTGAAEQTGQADQTDEIPQAHIDSDAGGNGSADGSAGAVDADGNGDDSWQHPGAPLKDDGEEDGDDDKTPAPIKDIIGGANAGPSFKPLSDHDGGDPDNENVPHELIDIKQKALTDLMPLVDQLDQTPEDKFRTTMMMIQASDDQSLVKRAYEAAHAIENEKVRAQALLDIVNEINYFTQHPEN